jgi:hypothetical protein
VVRRRISPVDLADAAVEAALVAGWLAESAAWRPGPAKPK